LVALGKRRRSIFSPLPTSLQQILLNISRYIWSDLVEKEEIKLIKFLQKNNLKNGIISIWLGINCNFWIQIWIIIVMKQKPWDIHLEEMMKVQYTFWSSSSKMES
jgi:hypothetical protein